MDLYHPWLEEYRIFLKETSDDSRFIFLGYVDDILLAPLFSNAKCNLLLSRDEGFGLSYIEAASQKTPSVLSDIEIFHETAGENAVFAKHEDPKHIASVIDKLISNEPRRKKIGEKAYTHCKKYYPENFSKHMLDILL